MIAWLEKGGVWQIEEETENRKKETGNMKNKTGNRRKGGGGAEKERGRPPKVGVKCHQDVYFPKKLSQRTSVPHNLGLKPQNSEVLLLCFLGVQKLVFQTAGAMLVLCWCYVGSMLVLCC